MGFPSLARIIIAPGSVAGNCSLNSESILLSFASVISTVWALAKLISKVQMKKILFIMI
jgi:hypothetical protein